MLPRHESTALYIFFGDDPAQIAFQSEFELGLIAVTFEDAFDWFYVFEGAVDY